ncbi:hypothetical protein VPH35_107079 [Triticum aestivum]
MRPLSSSSSTCSFPDVVSSSLVCCGAVTRSHRHGQGDDCSPTPPPSARSDDSSKLCGTACAERRAARAPLPQPSACPTTRPRPHCCRRPATRRRLSRCFSRPRNRNAPRAWRPRHLHRPSQKALPRPAPA